MRFVIPVFFPAQKWCPFTLLQQRHDADQEFWGKGEKRFSSRLADYKYVTMTLAQWRRGFSPSVLAKTRWTGGGQPKGLWCAHMTFFCSGSHAYAIMHMDPLNVRPTKLEGNILEDLFFYIHNNGWIMNLWARGLGWWTKSGVSGESVGSRVVEKQSGHGICCCMSNRYDKTDEQGHLAPVSLGWRVVVGWGQVHDPTVW